MWRLLTVCSVAALTSCVGTVDTTRVDHRYDKDTALVGVSYALPMLQYEITVTHTLTDCGPEVDENGVLQTDSLAFDTKVDPKARHIPGERFNIDYRKLSGLFRTSSFSIENYPNGTIKSIGVKAEDKTADAIKSAAKLAGGVVALTAGIPPFGTGTAGGQSALGGGRPTFDNRGKIWGCTEDTKDLLGKLNGAKEKLRVAKADLAKANNQVEKLAKRFALKVIVDGDSAEWDQAIDEQLNTQQVLKAAKKNLADSKAPLSKSYVLNWPESRIPNSGELRFSDKFVRNGSLKKPWLGMFKSKEFSYKKAGKVKLLEACDIHAGNKLIDCLSEHMDMKLHFVRDWPLEKLRSDDAINRDREEGNTQRLDGSTVDTINGTFAGLFYREPARGGLIICLRRKAIAGGCDESTLAKSDMVNFPQDGQLRFVPFKVLPFQGKDQSIVFSEDGYPTKIVLKSTKAAGAEALAAAANATQTLADAFEKREEERRSDAKAQRDEAVANLTTEIDLLEKQKKLAGLTAPASTPSEASLRMAELNADIELKRAEILQMLLTEGLASGSVDPVVLFGTDD